MMCLIGRAGMWTSAMCTGCGNGARVAAVVGSKCRGVLAGFVLLSYPLKVALLTCMVPPYSHRRDSTINHQENLQRVILSAAMTRLGCMRMACSNALKAQQTAVQALPLLSLSVPQMCSWAKQAVSQEGMPAGSKPTRRGGPEVEETLPGDSVHNPLTHLAFRPHAQLATQPPRLAACSPAPLPQSRPGSCVP